MPRKAAQKVTKANPLEGCAIATSGRFQGTTQSALQSRVTSLGATIASTVNSDTNYLVTTEKDFESNSTKVKAATTHGVPIVTLEWLEECESSNTKIDEAQYLLSSAAPAPTQKQNSSKKRAATPDTSSAPSQAQLKKPKIDESAKIGDGQNAKSSKITVAVDEYCPLGTYQVYIDDNNTIWDASLNQTNSSANNNKFYRVQLLCDRSGKDFKTWTRWGRVGERGQSALLGSGSLSDAMKNFEKKFKDKSGLKFEDRTDEPKPGKYAYVERSYNPDSDEESDAEDGAVGDAENSEKREPAQCTLNRPTQELMELIFNQKLFDATMSALKYDANKLPLGKLSKGSISRGFQALKDLAAILDDMDPSSHAEKRRLSDLYHSVIPHSFGRDRPPVIQDNDHLKREIELLESLSDMKEAAAMLKSSLKDDGGIHQLDRQFQGLGMEEMEPLNPTGQEFAELVAYLNDSKGATHYLNYTVQDIFRIQRKGEFERFEKSPYANIKSNRRLLWHGSRVTNFAGILSQGLRIAPPEAPVSGYMFGKGIYLADMSSKSANYCCAGGSGGTALLLLCEAELGDPLYELTDSSYNAGDEARANGSYSTWGKGQTGPSKWKDASCVNPALAGCMMPDITVKPGPTNVPGAYLQYNEFIVYDVAQVRLRYLLRVRM